VGCGGDTGALLAIILSKLGFILRSEMGAAIEEVNEEDEARSWKNAGEGE
jgi:hypothetical protein